MITTLRLRCLVGVHEDVRCFDQNRIYLRCIHCGRETEGWVTRLVLSEIPNTQPYLDAAYQELLDVDLESRHGG